MEPWRCPRWVPALVLAATVGQLAVATFVPGIEQFEGKAFGARLVAYPFMMLTVPALWKLHQRRSGREDEAPWGAFALVMTPFLVDVTGTSLDLYDSIDWWDNANHFLNWIPLCAGIGLVLCRDVRPRWAVVLLVTGFGAILALGWEIGEWYTFIRHGTELDTAYEDTLSDEALGTSGGFVAALFVAWRGNSARAPQAPDLD
jgi:hypothetical protein